MFSTRAAQPTLLRRLVHRKASVPVDELCIPLRPPYSMSSYIPAPTPLSRAVLLKLHKLSALTAPSTEEGWKALESLGGLVAVIEGVRGVDTGRVQTVQGRLVDGRVRAKATPLAKQDGVDLSDGHGRQLLALAELTEGSYYVARTPEGIRGKKRAG